MELRLQSKQTIRIQVSDDCTLHTLKQTLLQTLCSSLPPDSVHLSLDRNHDLEESSLSENSLRSLGINSGDLVFFTFNRTIERSQSIDSDLEPIGVVPKNCPKSILLSRVMKKQLGAGRNAHKLLVVAAHAVLLDSGLFSIARIDIPEKWPSTPTSTIAIRYTIGEPYTKNEGVLVRFRSLLHSVAVYESVDFRIGSNVYQVTLDEGTFGPNLDSIWANLMSSNRIIDEDEWNNIERKMCELWKVVKDGLVLPIFMILPHDIMLKIVKSLSGVDIAKLQCVCNELWNLGNDKDLWRLKLNQEFPWVVDPPNEEWKKKFGKCHRNRMNMNIIAIQMEQDQPPQPNVVYGDGYNVWQTYIPPAWHYDFEPNPVQYAYGPYHYWGGQNAFDPHHGWQWQGQGQNVYYPYLEWQGLGQNAFNPHHGVQGRGRGREQGRGRGRGR